MKKSGNSSLPAAFRGFQNMWHLVSRFGKRTKRAFDWARRSQRAGSTALSLLMIGFLMQGLTLSLFVSPTLASANTNPIQQQDTATASATVATPSNNSGDGLLKVLPHAFANTYYVKAVGDPLPYTPPGDCASVGNTDCNLRGAILVANGDLHGSNQDLILLAPGTEYSINASLPTVSSHITISNTNDQSCPGGLPNDAVLINHGFMPANSDMLILSSNDVISGIDTDGATQDGTVLAGSNNVLTCGIAERSTRDGVSIVAGATNNQIGLAGNGGTIGNIDFSAINNGSVGILIDGVGTTGNVVKNAGVGYYPPTGSYPNSFGIVIAGGATGNYIGSATNPQQYVNLIVNNIVDGVEIFGTGANGNTLTGNYIGVDKTGLAAAGNGGRGLLIGNGASNNQIGGSGTGQANYIGANGYSGIAIEGSGTNNNKVQGNVIGIKGDFSGPLSNGTSVGTRTGARVCTPGSGSGGTPDTQSEDCNGVYITASGSSVGPTGNLIGGDSRAGQGNLIASTASKYNSTGVLLDFASGNTIQGNSIGARSAGGTVTGYPSNNNTIGIWLINGSSNNQLGGDSSLGQGNLLGSVTEGINLSNSNFTNPAANPLGPMNGNKLQGNAVGVDFGGNPNPGLAIGLNGFSLYDAKYIGVNNNLIGVDYSSGAPNPKLGNLIGNSTNAGGIGIYANLNTDNYDSSNQFNGNYIGVKADGSAGAGNPNGIVLYGTTNSRVQGNYTGAANLSIAATSYGLVLDSSESNATITGNYIGTNTAGADLHNSIGVLVGNGSTKNTFSQNTIGRNTLQGFQLTDTTANRNTFSQNSIFGNGGPGINLNYTAANPNGIVGGSSTGPNNQAAKPTITAATLSSTSLKVSGTANPASSVEIFLGDDSGSTQGKTYLATVPTNALNSAGTFTDVVLSIPGGISFPPNPKLVATSTLLTPANYAGSTSQFSNAFSNITLIGSLTVAPTTLNFGATQGGGNPAAQTANLSANLTNINFTSSISYGAGASGWLTVSPTSGTANAGTSVAVSFTPTTGSLAAGTYTATVTFQDTANANDTVSVAVTFTVAAPPPPTTFTYNLPLLANNADTPVGHITTFITFQNLSASATANISVQYYGIANGNVGPVENPITIPAKGQTAIPSNIPSGSSFGGVVTSSQPLNLVVSESLNGGGSAYNVAASTASTLYSPLALNGQYGFMTSIIVFNAGSSGNATGQIQFYDETGTPAGATQTLNIPAHASQIFKQSDPASGLNGNHAYWAKISGAAGSQLTAQVIEFGPANFVATFNAIVPSQVQNKLYAPATFNGQFNFVTGMAIANPNAGAANVTITYYNATGTLLQSQAVTIPANGVIGVFQPNVAGLSNTVSSAVISSTQPLISTINERGPGTISGTYVGLASPSTSVALPVMAKGFASFVTGATVLNTGSSPATLTLTYYDQTGAQVGTPQTPPALAPNASFLVYQGDAAQGLPANFFGTALITSNQPLLVTTNALQTGTGLFYTYTEPSN